MEHLDTFRDILVAMMVAMMLGKCDINKYTVILVSQTLLFIMITNL